MRPSFCARDSVRVVADDTVTLIVRVELTAAQTIELCTSAARECSALGLDSHAKELLAIARACSALDVDRHVIGDVLAISTQAVHVLRAATAAMEACMVVNHIAIGTAIASLRRLGEMWSSINFDAHEKTTPGIKPPGLKDQPTS